MHKYLSTSLNSVVSLDFETSWAAKSLQEALQQAKFDAKFQQKQIQEREEKLVRLYENQQQKVFERVNRGSAGSNASVSSTGGGKVRQMFDERRQKAGIDRSYPLEPLKAKTVGQTKRGTIDRFKNQSNKTIVKSTTQKSFHQTNHGKIMINNEEAHTIYNNNNGDQTYEELHYECDNINKAFINNTHSDIIDMMANHNLIDNLDNEEMPQLEIDEEDELEFTGKLSNVGGKLPSEVAKSREQSTTKSTSSSLGKTFRKDTKPIVRRSIKSTVPTQSLSPSTSVHSQPSRTTTSSLSSPVRSLSQTMQSTSKTTPIKKGTSQPPQSARAPCNTRPSSKQSTKSPVARDDLNECRYCNRRFAADRLELHETICGKSMKKKRKVYDATKHRLEGTELESYTRRGKSLSNKPTKQPPKKDWRRTHEEFINAIRAAKMAQAHVAKGGKLTDLPPPPPSSNPDYVQCPHCGRKFNEAAAERHIPKCANYAFNKPKPGQAQKGKISARK